MDNLILTKVLGILFLVIGLKFVFNRKGACAIAADMVKHPASQFMAGIFPLLIGSWVVLTHNVWALKWSLVLTVVGWLMLLVGIIRLWLTSAWVDRMENSSERMVAAASVISVIFGVLLCYVGFFTS